MFDGLQTVAILSVVTILTSLLSYLMIKRYVPQLIEYIVEAAFENPMAKQLGSMLGQRSGEKRSQNAMMDSIATDILSGPKFSALKIGASALGIDVDSYIAEKGAPETLQALAQIGQMLGINITDIIAGGLTEGHSPGGSGRNPYL